MRWTEEEKERESFFNIFKTYEGPNEENEDEELEEFVRTDLMIGQTISEEFIMNPVGHYLGEVDYDDDIEGLEEGEDDEEEEEEKPVKKGKNQPVEYGGKQGKKGGQKEEECKNNWWE